MYVNVFLSVPVDCHQDLALLPGKPLLLVSRSSRPQPGFPGLVQVEHRDQLPWQCSGPPSSGQCLIKPFLCRCFGPMRGSLLAFLRFNIVLQMPLVCVQLKENGLNVQLCDLKFSCCFVSLGKKKTQKINPTTHAVINVLQVVAALAGARQPTWHRGMRGALVV